MATPKDTLTAYTPALNTIDALDISGSLIEFVYIPDGQFTLRLNHEIHDPVVNGHIYKLRLDSLGRPVHALLAKATVHSGETLMEFKRMSTDMELVVKAVLAEMDAQDQMAADRGAVSYEIPRGWTFQPVTVRWDRHSPYPVWTYRDSPQWREGEGNNP